MNKLLLCLIAGTFLMSGSAFALLYDDTTGSTATGTSQTSISASQASLNTNASSVVYGTDVVEDPEFLQALFWMYDNELTKFKNPRDFRSFDRLTREEASKIIGKFYKDQLKWGQNSNISSCVFKDLDVADYSLTDSIKESCKLGLFQWRGGNFNPRLSLTKAQAIAVLIRMFDGKLQDETLDPRYTNYYKKALELWLTKETNMKYLDRELTRYEIALLIYRFKIKYQLLKDVNGISKNKDEVMTMVANSVVTDAKGNKAGKMLFDTSLLSNENMNSLTIDIFGQKYKIVKRKVDSYTLNRNSFGWYGELFTIDEKEYLGTVSFTVINGFLDEASIIPTKLWDKYYIIDRASVPYYTIIEKSGR